MSHSSESNGAMNATDGVGSGGASQQRELLGEDEALAAHALDLDGHERAALDQLLVQLVASTRSGVDLGGAMRSNVPPAPPAPSRPWARYRDRSLCRSCSRSGTSCASTLRGEQPFEEVVVPAVAVAPREADHARDGVRLEHGAHGVLRHPEPVLRRARLALEVERRQRPFRADPFEHALGHGGVLGESRGVEPGPLAAHDMTEPGELAGRHERQRLVGRLEDLAAFVQRVAPGGLVAGDARVQHEVVVPAGDRDRVELDRPELPEDLEHAVGASRERPRGREEVPRDEKAPRVLSSDLHAWEAGEGVALGSPRLRPRTRASRSVFPSSRHAGRGPRPRLCRRCLRQAPRNEGDYTRLAQFVVGDETRLPTRR